MRTGPAGVARGCTGPAASRERAQTPPTQGPLPGLLFPVGPHGSSHTPSFMSLLGETTLITLTRAATPLTVPPLLSLTCSIIHYSSYCHFPSTHAHIRTRAATQTHACVLCVCVCVCLSSSTEV